MREGRKVNYQNRRKKKKIRKKKDDDEEDNDEDDDDDEEDDDDDEGGQERTKDCNTNKDHKNKKEKTTIGVSAEVRTGGDRSAL